MGRKRQKHMPSKRKIRVGNVEIGGGSLVSVQSMTNTDTRDADATVAQIKKLDDAGCEIIRIAIPDIDAAKNISKIKKSISIPLIADIHFDFRFALEAIKQGVDALRINPGNIGSSERVCEVAAAAKDAGIPIRVGSNSGSVAKKFLEKYKGPTPEAIVESALEQVGILENAGFDSIKIAVKASNVKDTVEAYRLVSRRVEYPLHLGVTEAGTLLTGSVRSSTAMGILLSEGIGDTVRVSLTADPIFEVKVAHEILASLGLRKRVGVELISCPTCGRVEYDVEGLASRLEKALLGVKRPLKIAVMGCVVNGPGEAKAADFAVVGGKGQGIIFKKGEIVAKCDEGEIEKVLLREIDL